MTEERKKFTLYLHPDRDADRQALEVIEAVPRSARGE
ncbi:plasmid stability protein, partial [Salmonella enterica]|nr:plasmid stability protein [Salmonella enterica]